ncbi:tyrosine protein phosphatase [Halalkalibacillus sediminis]|uniref:Tyrosine-protein phosphatase n=1 Tax=Halalkalibacillus sediminis TaxID=2018042 RepID=A0A2I0QUY8_9BACI|nr:CpsB/CapC family capsule biosynthesis tyrosine phosphatase [Halalkalibacillus sediminis]PKR78167.1 tyrosine protein phosphatase [Halalkalibacillus sediminis]
MIDIHSHILPNVDDGARSIEDSLMMAEKAVEEGITHIYATPHHLNGHYENDKEFVLNEVEKLNAHLKHNHIPLTVIAGQELRINGDLLELMHDGDSMTLGNGGGYLLIEFSHSHIPRFSNKLLFDLRRNGYTPIIVHPERNKEIMEEPNKLFDLVNNGCLAQLTAGSLLGKFGKKVQEVSHQLLEANLVHFLASDAHNITSRGFFMQEAYDYIEKEYGAYLSIMLKENAEILMNSEMVIGDPPEVIKTKKKFLGLF